MGLLPRGWEVLPTDYLVALIADLPEDSDEHEWLFYELALRSVEDPRHRQALGLMRPGEEEPS